MTTAGRGANHYLSHFTATEQQLPGHNVPWLRELRRAAVTRFEITGFPTRRDENWKYTSVQPIEKRDFRIVLQPPKSGLTVANLRQLLPDELDCFRVVFVNGHYSEQLSDLGGLPGGVEVTGVAAMLRDDPAILEPLLVNSNIDSLGAFAALNTGFMTDGAFIRLAANTVLDRPICLLHVIDNHETAVTSQIRNIIVTQPGSAATVIESYAGVDGVTGFTNAVTDIVVADNAALDHYKLQQENTSSFHISAINVHQRRDSRYRSHSISLGAALARTDIHTLLDAEGAECLLNGFYMANGKQHVDNHTRVDHAKPCGRSSEYYKGVMDGHAHAVFNGKVVVHEQAQKSDASQSNRNLLLSRNAQVDTKPELEIYADDVKCAHGATVGQLDEKAIFYLRSRGVDEKLARNLLTYAFAEDIIERIGLPPLQKQLEEIVLARLPEGNTLRNLV